MPRSGSFYLVLLLITQTYLSFGQSNLAVNRTNTIVPNLVVERYNSHDGLPDDRVRAIFQDSRGFLWIGTQNGLCQYDGYRFKKYYKSNHPNHISGNFIYAICEDTAHRIWIGSSEGLNLFDPNTEQFTNFHHQPGNPTSLIHDRIKSLLVDQSGRVWIGTAGGLTSFEPKTQSFRQYKQHPLTTTINSIIRSKGDYIWISTTDGLVHYNIRTNQFTLHRLSVRADPYGERFWAMAERGNDLYVATSTNGLVKLAYNQKAGVHDSLTYLTRFGRSGETLAQTELFDLCLDNAGDLWLATDRGLAKLENLDTPSVQLRFYRTNPQNTKSISSDRIYKVRIDNTAVLWCGTEMGINKLDLTSLPFQYYTFTGLQPQDQVRSMATYDGQHIWIGAGKQGIYQYDIRTGITKTMSLQPEDASFQSVRSMAISPDKALWIGTLGGALHMHGNQLATYQKLLNGRAVFALLPDSKGNVWVGTTNGLLQITKEGKVLACPLGSMRRQNPDFIWSLLEDHQGRIWVGMENNGLGVIDPQTRVFTPINGQKPNQMLTGSAIYSLIESPKNVIWAGSESGLNRISMQPSGSNAIQYTVRTYHEPDGLPEQSVKSLLADSLGYLWISTSKGLARLDPSTNQFSYYLPTLSFTPSSRYKFSDRNLLFGTTDGFVKVDPTQIARKTVAPRVALTEFKLFNKEIGIGEIIHGDVVLNQSIATTREVTLNYQNTVFTIGFTALHFANPSANTFAYRLQGFDKDWITTTSANRTATYTNLDPGTYQFFVKATNNAGEWSSQPAQLIVTILPPPWKTGWAIAFYVLLFNGLLFGFIRYILSQSRQRQQLLYEQREREQLQKLEQAKLQFFTDVSHEFRTPLSLIVGPVNDLQQVDNLPPVVQQKISLIRRNSQKLLHLIDELMTFEKLDQGMLKLKPGWQDLIEFTQEVCSNFGQLATARSMTFEVLKPNSRLPFWFDADKLEKVLTNLIANAFKFTPDGGIIRVEVDTIPDNKANLSVCLRVTDTGTGITADELPHVFERFFQSETSQFGTGVGLSLTKNLVELHGGTISVTSTPGVQTCFSVILPGTELYNSATVDQQIALVSSYTNQVQVPIEIGNELADGHTNDAIDDQPLLLLVDDNHEILDYLYTLFRTNYRVIRAGNGREALQQISIDEPDAIISDIIMPETDGIELCRTLKSDLNTCHIPIILLTARATVEHTLEGLQTGADDYVSKPFQPELLRVRVQTLIQMRKQLIEKYRTNPTLSLPSTEATLHPLDNAFLQKVHNTIMTNLSNEEFSVEALGDAVSMSRSNLFRKLKAITGQTPLELIYHIRLQRGRELLMNRQLTISEITYEVGFKTPSSFSKSFKKQFGKTPKDYLNDALIGLYTV
ncbi:response regulator [Spirosoma sp. HMF4905]|uniref:histidine kinase n=1 Tax=Spirosoma arboris TaxID=2682092 RepID=A0A7K1SH92_9BACT|nr:two-component regulator propeller domain-containing protein [Spirosoma arboris]MVM33177.1 response regulator [Spirosoma arboris]